MSRFRISFERPSLLSDEAEDKLPMHTGRSGLNAALVRLRHMVWRSRLLQIGLLVSFWAVGEGLVRLTGLPVPGGVIGLALVLAFLGAGWIRPGVLRRGAYWLLAEMLLFFAPAVMVLLDHQEFAGLMGLKIAFVIVIGTVLVMGGTAFTVDLFLRWSMRREQRHVDA